MKYVTKNKASSTSVIYESPEISVIKMKDDIITCSPTSDANEGEWDVEGEE